MKKGKGIPLLSCLVMAGIAVFLLLFCAKPKQNVAIDYESLAERLVNQCAGIKEGDCVQVSGGVRDMELLEDLAIHVRQVGAFPLVLVGSDRMDRGLWTDVPEKWDTQKPILDEKLNNILTSVIYVDYREKSDLLADIPAKRVETRNQANTQLFDSYMKRRIREVNLGNGLYPTVDKAKQYDIPLETLTKMFWNGVNVNYVKLKTICEAVKAVFAGGNEIRITNANGTDLTFGIKGRTVFSSDGIIPPDDPKKKAPPAAWLPAGEVITTPIPGTAKGRVVVERQFFQGKEITGMSLIFEQGKVVSFNGGTGGEKLLERYQLAGQGKDLMGFVDIGTNPNIQIPARSRMVAYMPSGAITIGIGRNDYYGGENMGSFGFDFFLPGYTLAVDGKVMVENGELKF